ncbi:MAG: quinone-dependent dihydroorotate dehydrogenase, partial [Succinivibrio sp.]
LFMLEPEKAHDLIIGGAALAVSKNLTKFFSQKVEYRPVEVMGLKFKNPVGLAAGLDKNGEAIDFFGSLGFGYIEVGTVTPKPQDGNPQPRMFRIVEGNGLINRMGFNNKGVDYLVENLKICNYDGIIGVSIGKNETTPIECAVNDYLICMDKVYQYADYIAVNISCPNTPGLTKLQAREPLEALLKPLKQRQLELQAKLSRYVPLVVKISPDLTDENLKTLCELCVELGIDGMNCTNTTVSRDIVNGLEHTGEWGGLSGQPLRAMSNETLSKVNSYTEGKIALIGVGGVCDVVSAREKMLRGASLVQLYSSLIYKGPHVVKEIVDNL